MDELGERLKAQTEHVGGLWRRVRRECGAKDLAQRVAQLGKAQRQLAARDATWPHTADAGRRQRSSIEFLQSHTRALELQALKVKAAAHELEVAAERRLEALEALLEEAPTPARLEWAAPAHPLLIALLLGVALHVWLGQGPGFADGFVMVVAAISHRRTRLDFDGRTLRISYRVLGLTVWRLAHVDLADLNRVVLRTHELTHRDGAYSEYTQVVVRSPDAEQVVWTEPAGTGLLSLWRQLRGNRQKREVYVHALRSLPSQSPPGPLAGGEGQSTTRSRIRRHAKALPNLAPVDSLQNRLTFTLFCWCAAASKDAVGPGEPGLRPKLLDSGSGSAPGSR